MPDLDGLRTDELRRFGFVPVSDTEAKHMVHDTARYKCGRCGLWFERVYEKPEGMLCRDCCRDAVTSS
jgi:hypothetical protein